MISGRSRKYLIHSQCTWRSGDGNIGLRSLRTRANPKSREGRLRRDRVVLVVGDVLAADHDRISSGGGVAGPAADAGAEAALKGNKAASGVATPAADAGPVIEGGIAFAAADTGVIAAGSVALTAADACAEAAKAGAPAASGVAVAAADAGIVLESCIEATAADAGERAAGSVRETAADACPIVAGGVAPAADACPITLDCVRRTDDEAASDCWASAWV
jgi:hypothetical protein